jgi:DNA-binding transcriptional MerR regulator
VGGWTLAELAELAARALDEGGVRVASGRVTEIPDPRVIRWYTTIGLLDRPTIGAGRVARYGVRHLLQLVAVKRLQAQGLSLAQIQHRLAGATDDQLRAVAALPEGLTDERAAVAPEAPGRTAAAAAVTDRAGPTPTPFWRPQVDSGGDTVSRVYGVRLPGLTLLLAKEPAPHDLPEIVAAARPLLDLLASRDLLREQTGPRDLLDPTEGAQR